MHKLFSCLGLAAGLVSGAGAQAPAHVFVKVTLAATATAPVSGRVLVFFKQGTGDGEVNTEEFRPAETWVAAREVHDLKPGASVEVDGTDVAFPASFATMPAGHWEAQAVLDPEHTYNYSGRGPEDWISAVKELPGWSGTGTAAEPELTLTTHPPASEEMRKALAELQPMVKPGVIEEQSFVSPALTKFWGRPTRVRAWVVLPPGYADHPAEHYPTAYWTHGFGGTFENSVFTAARISKRMAAGQMPPMIWVMLDESLAEGTHEFADSANNGPWGTALTTEYIPMLEQKYRMDARPDGRFLNGHSSGGWATLQLQINYPAVFGGTWSTSPDPSDFHNFTGPDLYAASANVYRKPDGAAWPIMRADGKVVATLQQFAQLEDVLGPYGGQIRSFDWVFSPRAKNGAPEFMFDHATGAVNPTVVSYWHDHFDLAHLAEAEWPTRGAMLRGRIHLYVGTADTFYLDGSARLMEARLNKLGAEPHFTYLPGRSHFDVYVVDKDRAALFDTIGAQMYAVARPGQGWTGKK